jgi:hypothetical protein
MMIAKELEDGKIRLKKFLIKMNYMIFVKRQVICVMNMALNIGG